MKIRSSVKSNRNVPIRNAFFPIPQLINPKPKPGTDARTPSSDGVTPSISSSSVSKSMTLSISHQRKDLNRPPSFSRSIEQEELYTASTKKKESFSAQSMEISPPRPLFSASTENKRNNSDPKQMFLEGNNKASTIYKKILKTEKSSRPHRNRNRSRWSSKRRRRSSTPTGLQLHGDDSDGLEDAGHDQNDIIQDPGRHKSTVSSPIPWNNELHRYFVSAVFEIGIEQSSPAVIAEQMITKNNYNTLYTDRVTDSALQSEKKNKFESTTPCESAQSTSSVLQQTNNNDDGNNFAVATAAALAIMGEDGTKTENQQDDDDLPEEAEYYKQELTGERLKSHLQKLRKQSSREKDAFLGDYDRFLNRQEMIDEEEKRVEKAKEQRKKEARRRRLKHKRAQTPSTLLDASAFDHISDGRSLLSSARKGYENKEDVTKEEEERLLSIYLPLRSSVTSTNNGSSVRHEDYNDFDSEEDSGLSAIPVGGRAIGMVTWAVRKQEMEKRKTLKQRQRQFDLQQPKDCQQEEPPTPNGWETASVDSWTSDTAIAAGKFVRALGPGRRGPAATEGGLEEGAPDCASSEDDHTDSELESLDDEFEHFRASVPTLTEAEKSSPLGVSLRLTWDMIKHMSGVIAETRASVIKEHDLKRKLKAQRQRQKQNQQGSPGKEGSASKAANENSPPRLHSSKAGSAQKFYLSPGSSKVDGNDTGSAIPRVTTGEKKGNYHLMSNHPASATAVQGLLDHRVWNVPKNPHLLAAMAANGAPPENFAQALSGIALEELGTPLLLNAILANPPSAVVTPQLQPSIEKQEQQQQQLPPPFHGLWNPFSQHRPGSTFAAPVSTGMPAASGGPSTTSTASSSHGSLLRPLAPPKDLWAGLHNSLAFVPESRSHSPVVSLSTPTTPTEAMFRSLLHHTQQQSKENANQSLL